MLQVHVRVHESANRTQIYHVGAKPFFTAIGGGQPQSTLALPYPIKLKLMGLDFVLAHRQHHYLATEGEKLDYFVSTLGLNRSFLPQRIYRSRYRQVSAVSPRRTERAVACGRALLCGRQHREAFGVR